jgi:nucleoside-diphosphate-sugar epimerase
MPVSVVTGGAGFIGSHLCEYLLAKGDRVIAIDNLGSGSKDNIKGIQVTNASLLSSTTCGSR